MDIIEAIQTRVSCRAFEARPLEESTLAELEAEIERINEESGLRFQLYGPREDGTAPDVSLKMFASKPPCYAAFVGPVGPEPEERLGYYGERFVLFATQLGLGTCWVAGTYEQATTRAEVGEGEKLHDVIPLGYAPAKMPLKQRTIRSGIRARDKKLSALWNGARALSEEPAWVQACVLAVQRGPSAVNEQPVVFTRASDDEPIRAKLARVKSGLEYTDLGIAKLHFELVARECGIDGRWEWGAGGVFIEAEPCG